MGDFCRWGDEKIFCWWGAPPCPQYGKILRYVPTAKCWKRFCDDVFVLWENSRDDLDKFFKFMSSTQPSKEIQLTRSCPTYSVLDFLDLTLSLDVTPKQILVNVLENLPVSLFP